MNDGGAGPTGDADDDEDAQPVSLIGRKPGGDPEAPAERMASRVRRRRDDGRTPPPQPPARPVPPQDRLVEMPPPLPSELTGRAPGPAPAPRRSSAERRTVFDSPPGRATRPDPAPDPVRADPVVPEPTGPRPDRSRRTRWTAVAAAVLALLVGGFVVGRGSVDRSAPESRTAPPSPAPTTASPPAAVGAGLAGSPTRLGGLGVPLGYPRSAAGAASACGNFTDAYEDIGNRTPARLGALFLTIAVPDQVGTLTSAAITDDRTNAYLYGVPDVTSTAFDQQWRVAGYRAQSFTPDQASVQVWSTLGLGRFGATDENAPREFWSTQTCSLRWSGGDWRLTAISEPRSGPAITDPAAASFTRYTVVGR